MNTYEKPEGASTHASEMASTPSSLDGERFAKSARHPSRLRVNGRRPHYNFRVVRDIRCVRYEKLKNDAPFFSRIWT
jgi:hypothetical protein